MCMLEGYNLKPSQVLRQREFGFIRNRAILQEGDPGQSAQVVPCLGKIYAEHLVVLDKIMGTHDCKLDALFNPIEGQASRVHACVLAFGVRAWRTGIEGASWQNRDGMTPAFWLVIVCMLLQSVLVVRCTVGLSR